MKKRLLLLLFVKFMGITSYAQNYTERTLSYSQLFSEMISYQEGSIYHLKNATIIYNAATDQRFLEMDSIQLASYDTLKIKCEVRLEQVHFKNSPRNSSDDFSKLVPRIGLQKIQFVDTLEFYNSRIEIRSIQHCTFNYLGIIECDFSSTRQNFYIINCQFENSLELYRNKVRSNFIIENSELNGLNNWMNHSVEGYLLIKQCQIDEIKISWSKMDRIIFQENTVKIKAEFSNLTNRGFQIYKNHFTNLKSDSVNALNPLFICGSGKYQKFYWSKNTYDLQNKNASCFFFRSSTISNKFTFQDTEFPNHITLRDINVTGAFKFGSGCKFTGGIFLKDLYFNERSTIGWSTLKDKIRLSDYKGLRQFPESIDSMQRYGLLERELGNTEYCEALIKNKRTFYNVFRLQGLTNSANAVMVEIKDLETEIWKHAYLGNKTIKAYFNWKINVFLKKFSAYGTDPVLAIIYSIKVILLFGLLYLFFHNDWDIGSRKKIGQRLQFMLKYFKVNKGLAELDDESQSEAKNEVQLLKLENEDSIGKIPGFFRQVVPWYVKSNMISDSLRKTALKKMDILSGTYSELPKNRKTRVALLSGIWFVAFLLYSLLLKILNAITLSLNAFTTLGFGNIPTKGFSRYIVIIQGFIGWVLMTTFSVTLISQLIQ